MENNESHPLADFRNLVYMAWSHLNLPAPTPIQYDIAEYLQHGPKRLLVMAYRGVGKSWLTSVFACHQLLMNPSANILVVSAGKARADDFSTFCQQLIRGMPALQHLRPREDQRDSKIAFDVGPAPPSHAPSCRALGVTSAITGSRADLIIADDVESLNNSMTQNMREKVSESVKEFDAVLKPGGRIIYLGTPQVDSGSIYSLLPARGYESRVWPARYPTPSQVASVYGDALAPYISEKLSADLSGRPTDPSRFDDDDLLEREMSYGRSGCGLQFQLDTSMSDELRFPLKLSDLVVMDLASEVGPEKVIRAADPDLAWDDSVPNVGFKGDRYYRPMQIVGDLIPWQGSVMAVDPAGRGKDECGYAVVKMLNGQLFLTASGGLRSGYTDVTLETLATVAKEQKVNYVLVEANFGDGMFLKLLLPFLQRIYPVTVEEVRHSKTKEFRIVDYLEPIMNQGKLIVDRRVVQDDFSSTQGISGEDSLKYQLFYQMTRLTKERGCLRFDDRIDALSMACGYWIDQLGRDIDDALKEREEEKLQVEIEEFKDSFHNFNGSRGRPKEPNWIGV